MKAGGDPTKVSGATSAVPPASAQPPAPADGDKKPEGANADKPPAKPSHPDCWVADSVCSPPAPAANEIAITTGDRDNPFTPNDYYVAAQLMGSTRDDAASLDVLHPNRTPGELVYRPQGGDKDRKLADRLREECTLSRFDGVDSAVEEKCDALIDAVERRADNGWRDYLKYGGITTGTTAGGLAATGWIFGTWKNFGELARKVIDTFNFRMPPPGSAGGHGGLPTGGNAPASEASPSPSSNSTPETNTAKEPAKQTAEAEGEAANMVSTTALLSAGASMLYAHAQMQASSAVSSVKSALPEPGWNAGFVATVAVAGCVALVTAPVWAGPAVVGGASYGAFLLVDKNALSNSSPSIA